MRLIPRFGYRLWTSKMTAALKLMVIKSNKSISTNERNSNAEKPVKHMWNIEKYFKTTLWSFGNGHQICLDRRVQNTRLYSNHNRHFEWF
jgi:hypothetical protein